MKLKSAILTLLAFNKVMEVGLKKSGHRPLMTFRGLGGLQSETRSDGEKVAGTRL